MSQGRSNPRQQRAPIAAKARHCPASSSRANKSAPFRIGPSTLESAETWHARGVEHECEGRLDDAIACYRSALSVGGPDVQIVFDLAYALADAGQLAAAIERYRLVTEIDSCREDAWTNLGDLLIETGDFPAGLAALRRAAQLSPDDAAVQYNLADGLDDGIPADAADHWRAFIQLGSASDAHVLHASRRLGPA